MRRLLILYLFIPVSLLAQQSKVFSGKILDSENGEALINAAIYNISNNKFSYSDSYGGFSINVQNADSIEISYLGYLDTLIIIGEQQPQFANIFLVKSNQLETVEIYGKKSRKSHKKILSIDEITAIPTIGGTVDVIKSLQTLPGVAASQEGRSSLIVRGGSPGQNQYLLDKVPLVYVNHLGGFMSVFNAEMINGMELYNGVFPSKYSGSLSSILNIYQKEGNFKKWKGTFQAGLLEMNGSAEGPLSEKVSLMITGRKTFTELLMYSIISIVEQNNLIFYGFYDLNSKLTYRINSRNTLYFNTYIGDDYLDYRNKPWKNKVSNFKNTTIWGNLMFSARYKSVINSRLTSETILGYTKYRLKNNLNKPTGNDSLRTTKKVSNLANLILRSDWQYFVNDHHSFDFGFVGKYILSTPPHSSNNLNHSKENKFHAQVYSLYATYKLNLGNYTSIVLGLHGKHYKSKDYDESKLEPRVEFLWTADRLSLNAGYMRVSQESHLLDGTRGIFPNEVWIPAIENFPLSNSDIGTASIAYTMPRLKQELSIYYKHMNNVASYIDGYRVVFGDEFWKEKVTLGEGKSYGLEYHTRYSVNDIDMQLNYVYSLSFRTFKEINDGNEVRYNYDRPHQLNFTFKYRLNKNWNFSSHFVLASGLPYTEILGKYLVPDLDNPDKSYEVILYGEKNSARFSPYHRLDISATYQYKTKRRGRDAEWNFSIYNVYAQQNPYHYYLNINDGPSIITPSSELYDPSKLALYQISYFPAIPSFSYKIYFGTETKERGKKTRFKDWLFD